MCPVALALESRLKAAQVLLRVPWRQLWPPSLGQPQSRHVSHGALRAVDY
jgi:hypothetical protein